MPVAAGWRDNVKNLNKSKKISIVVPVYNAEKYLDCCIKSILTQSYQNFELLLVDDGSNDSSAEICDNYACKDDRITVIHQKNAGVSAARNAGIAVCSGIYLVFLDADDWWDREFLATMEAGMENADLVICDLVKCDKNGIRTRLPAFQGDMSQWCWPLCNHCSISCYRCMFDTALINKYGFRFISGRKTGEDQEFTYRYMLHTEKIASIPEAIYYYRINQNSTMFTANYNHFQAVDAMIAVEDYARGVCSGDRAEIISQAMRRYKCPYILEFAILTVLTAGDAPDMGLQYLQKNGYYDMLNEACKSPKHHDSKFMRMWKRSSKLCLRYYYIRRKIGKLVRKKPH